jgi:hypothetical protein
LTTELLTKLGFSFLSIFFVFVFVRSLANGEILFQQGKGTRYSNNKFRFIYIAIESGLFIVIFCIITICAWIYL